MREQFGLAPNTLDAYARAVDSYLAFLENLDHGCEASTQSDVAGWINESRARGLANSTLIQRVTALRLFFEYLVEEGLPPGNPVSRGGAFRCCGMTVFRTAGPIRRMHKLPWIPTDEEWERLLRATSEDSIRDRAMLALAYDGALRREELCSIMVSDFDFARKLHDPGGNDKESQWQGCVLFACHFGPAGPIPQSAADHAVRARRRLPLRIASKSQDADYLLYLDQGGGTHGSAQ